MKEFWDQRYGEDEYIYGTAPNDFLVEATPHIPAKGLVFTLAEGEGRNAVYLAEQGFNVNSIDFAAEGKAKAEKLAAERGVTLSYQVGDIAELQPAKEKWDAIVAIFAHVPPPVQSPMFKYIRDNLKDGGVVIFEGYTPDQIGRGTGGPPNAALMFSKDMLEKEFEGFDIIRSEEKLREVQEGAFHNGVGAVVQFIAVKK